MAEEEYQIPIFFINGQLDSGKTRFITETIEEWDSLRKQKISCSLYAKKARRSTMKKCSKITV